MPAQLPQPAASETVRPTRRLILAALAGPAITTVAGCSLRFGQPVAQNTPPPPTPDEIARERAASGCDRLGLAAREAARLRPDLAEPLVAIADVHTTQAAALRPVVTATATPTAQTPSASRASATSTLPPMTRKSAVQVLADAERAAVTALEEDLGEVSGPVVKGSVVKGSVVKGSVVKGSVVKGSVVKGSVVSGSAARLLASIAAAHAVNGVLLDELQS